MNAMADFFTTALRLRNRCLNLLETALTGTLYDDPSMAPWTDGSYHPERRAGAKIGRVLRRR